MCREALVDEQGRLRSTSQSWGQTVRPRACAARARAWGPMPRGEERETHSREEAAEALGLRGRASSSVPQGPPQTPATRRSGTWFGSEETGRTVGTCARACWLSR